MNKNNKIKKLICRDWKKNDCNFTKKECNFAHGEDDINKEKCFNGIYCWNEDCNYEHPQEWNPYNNKKECLFCVEGTCNKENKIYNHIKNINDNTKNIKDVILEIPKNEDFPEIIRNKYNNENKKLYKYKYSDVLKYDLIDYKEKETNDENLKEIENNIKSKLNIDDNNKIIDIKKQLKDNYILLKILDPKNWENYEEIDNIKDKINILEDKYNKIKNINKKENIFDDNLNLDTIFNENNLEDKYIPIKLTINGIEIDNSINYEFINIISKERNDDVEFLIENMEKDFKTYNGKIKKIINDIIKNDYLEFTLINNLNEISSMIKLFKNNYEDIKAIKEFIL